MTGRAWDSARSHGALLHVRRERGSVPFLVVERFLSLYLSVTKHEAKPQLVRWYEDEWSSVFDEYLYTGKDDFRLLRWVMARGIYSEVG